MLPARCMPAATSLYARWCDMASQMGTGRGYEKYTNGLSRNKLLGTNYEPTGQETVSRIEMHDPAGHAARSNDMQECGTFKRGIISWQCAQGYRCERMNLAATGAESAATAIAIVRIVDFI